MFDRHNNIVLLLTSENPNGSQFFEFCWIPANGIGSGPSPPTYPRQNASSAFKHVDDFTEDAGAKALADPAKTAPTASKIDDFAMVY